MPWREGRGPLGGHHGYYRGYGSGWAGPHLYWGGWGWRPRPYRPYWGWGWRPRPFLFPFPIFGGWGCGGCGLITGLLILLVLGLFVCSLCSAGPRFFSRGYGPYYLNTNAGSVISVQTSAQQPAISGLLKPSNLSF